MGFFYDKISRDELKPGDHIYSWRTLSFYAHHGIYVGDGKVVHFTSRNVVGKSSVSSSPNTPPCPNCGEPSRFEGVISSCLDCFLAGGDLYLYKYNVSWAEFFAKPRSGTCTRASSDPPEEVIRRANFLLEHNGFGPYHLLNNNCENFAVYCKTESLCFKRDKVNGSGMMGGQARSFMSTLKAVVLGLGQPVAGYSVSSITRHMLLEDGVITKVPVERLVEMNMVIEREKNAQFEARLKIMSLPTPYY